MREYQRKVTSEQTVHEENCRIEDSIEKLNDVMERREADMLEEREDMKRQLQAQKDEHRLEMEALREEHKREVEEMKKAREADREAILQEVQLLVKASQANEGLQQVLEIQCNMLICQIKLFNVYLT